MISTSLIETNKSFLTCLFSNLIFQLLLTFGILLYCNEHKIVLPTVFFVLFSILSLVLLILIMIMNWSVYTKFILYTIFSILFGFIISSDTIKSNIQNDMIKKVLLGTIGIFFILMIIGFVISYMNIDLSLLGGTLIFILSIYVLVEIIGIFFPYSNTTNKVMIYIGLVIFSFCVIYDINLVLQNKMKLDCVSSSLGLYLDFINIFLKLLQISNKN